MKTIILSSLLALSLSTACSKKSECEQVFEHTLSLLPAELKDKVKQSKADAIGKCEKMPAASRKCALDAKSMEDIMKCPRT
jgi:hypothetical protein